MRQMFEYDSIFLKIIVIAFILYLWGYMVWQCIRLMP